MYRRIYRLIYRKIYRRIAQTTFRKYIQQDGKLEFGKEISETDFMSQWVNVFPHCRWSYSTMKLWCDFSSKKGPRDQTLVHNSSQWN